CQTPVSPCRGRTGDGRTRRAAPGALSAPLCSDANGATVPCRAGPRLGRPAGRAAGAPLPLNPAERLKPRMEKVMSEPNVTMTTPPIVSEQEWEAARQQLLVKEKELTRARDALVAQRRRMPWLPVTTRYEFDGPQGKVSLLDLFEGRRQLIVYRAFFEPGVHGWPDHACTGCSMVADQVAD